MSCLYVHPFVSLILRLLLLLLFLKISLYFLGYFQIVHMFFVCCCCFTAKYSSLFENVSSLFVYEYNSVVNELPSFCKCSAPRTVVIAELLLNLMVLLILLQLVAYDV